MPKNDDLAYRATVAQEEDVVLQQAKRNENAYVASARQSVAASGGTVNMALTNPSGSGINVNVKSTFVRTQFQGEATIYDEFSSAPSGGTENGVDNLLMDTGNTTGGSTTTVREGVSFTAGGDHVKDVIPSGGAGGKVGGEAVETEPLIEPDREIVAEVQNDSGSQAKAAIIVVFVEEQRDT